MSVKVLKTFEIEEEVWLSYSKGFNDSFSRNKSIDELKAFYSNTVFGYSIHALSFEDNKKINGGSTIMPFPYLVNKEKSFFGLSVSSFVNKEFRKDAFLLHDLVETLCRYCKENNIVLFYGVPNTNSYSYFNKLLGFETLFNLNYYVIPFRIGSILKLKNKRFLNMISEYSFKLYSIIISHLTHPWDSKQPDLNVHLENNPEFLGIRFKNGYKSRADNGYSVTYKSVIEDNLKAIYVMDYRYDGIKSSRGLSYAICNIIKSEDPDIILYVGLIRHFQLNLFRLPEKWHPKKLPVIYKLIESPHDHFYSTISNGNNWDFSLINFDVR